jgi:hypothetical protein
MKTASMIGLLAMAVLLSTPAAAEFYRYTDSHGNVIYTDDLSKIPPDKRAEAKSYQSSAQDATDASQPEAPAQPSATQQEQDPLEAIRAEGERLQGLKEDLDAEYNSLAEENSKLKAEQKEAVTPDQIKAVNKKVVSFNARFKAYQEKSETYKTQVEAYNRKVEAAEAKQQ